MSVNETLRDHAVRDRLAGIRGRMATTLKGDQEALDVLDRVWPADWSRAPVAVIWMLGNAARFTPTDTNGPGPEFMQAWLDRLVDEDGTPRDV